PRADGSAHLWRDGKMKVGLHPKEGRFKEGNQGFPPWRSPPAKGGPQGLPSPSRGGSGWGWVVLSLTVLFGAGSAHAIAAPFPERPVRLIVPFPPGGLNDIVSRLIANQLNVL